MPIAMKARIMACVADGSFLIHVTIAVHAHFIQALLRGVCWAGNGSPGIVSVDTYVPPVKDLPSIQPGVCGHPGLPGPYFVHESLYVLASPRSVILVQHGTDGVRYPLHVAGIQVELAQRVSVLVGDGDGCLDRPR